MIIRKLSLIKKTGTDVLSALFFLLHHLDMRMTAELKGRNAGCYILKGSRVACPRIFRPICGTDQKTYNNECLLLLFEEKKRMVDMLVYKLCPC
uniref:Kazal-like domain-containing protein n=1 Tax=Prolemur simus TaxID=1328070 RepID=A0A8C9DM38_PROSS